MATYFLSYDLHHEDEHDYKALYKALETLGAIRVLESVWCLKANGTSASEIRATINRYVHNKDSFIVIEAEDWRGWNLQKSPNDI